MNQPLNSPGGKTFPLIPFLVVGSILVIVIGVSGFTFAARQEEHDSFCASCHSQPESTYFKRSMDEQSADLASYHSMQKTRCIDCHSGQGVSGRVQAELLGARNAAQWFSGTAVQPAQLNFPIGDENCLKCHQDVTQKSFTSKEQITVPDLRRDGEESQKDEIGGKGHYHLHMGEWLSRAPGKAGSCVSCHSSHVPGSSASAGFMSAPTIRKTCDACHQVLWDENQN